MKDNLGLVESPEGSNGSSLAETIEAEFGSEVTVTETDTDVKIEYPDNYTEEQKLKLQRRIDDFKLDANKLKERNMNVKKLEGDLETELERTKRLNDELEAQLRGTAPKPNTDNLYEQCWAGCKTAADVEELRSEDPEEYFRGLARYNEATSARTTVAHTRNEMVKNDLRKEGINPQEVEKFAKANGIPDLGVAADYFKLKIAHQPGNKGKVSLPEFQAKQVSLAPKGKGDGINRKQTEEQKTMNMRDVANARRN